MRFEIRFPQRHLAQGLSELVDLAPQLMGNMRIYRVYSDSKKTPSVAVELEKLDDIVTLLKTMRDMTEKGIEWVMNEQVKCFNNNL